MKETTSRASGAAGQERDLNGRIHEWIGDLGGKNVITVLRRIANSPEALILVFLATILTASILFTIAEGTSLLNSVYWSLVTATTLGYGDFSPHTVFGKVIASSLITFTVFIMIPTITANVAAWLIVNRDAFTDDEQELMKSELMSILALVKQEIQVTKQVAQEIEGSKGE